MSIDGAVETWSRQIMGPEDLPGECAALIPDLFPLFPYCVRSPAMRSYKISEPESFLCLGESRISVLKRRRTGVTVFQADLGSIDALETETTLLHSCITCYPRDGEPVSVHYNTVGEHLFTSVVLAYLKARGTPVPEPLRLRSIRPNPFQDLMKRDYKYHTHVFQVLPDDEARARFYHPAAFVPGLLHWLRLIPSYLLVASGSMLYSLSEKEPFRSRNRADYSLLVRYMPFSSGISAGFRALAGERRYRMVSLRAGTARFEIPLFQDLDSDFATFAQIAHLGTE